MANIFLVFLIFLLFHLPKCSWNKSAKYANLGKYSSLCTQNRTLTLLMLYLICLKIILFFHFNKVSVTSFFFTNFFRIHKNCKSAKYCFPLPMAVSGIANNVFSLSALHFPRSSPIHSFVSFLRNLVKNVLQGNWRGWGERMQVGLPKLNLVSKSSACHPSTATPH